MRSHMRPGILAPVALLAALLLSSAAGAEGQPLTLAAIGAGGQFDNASPVEGLVRRPAIDIKSRAALVVRADNGEVLYRKNSDRDVPIASITKLMTAMVVLDAAQSLDERLKITAEDIDRLRNTHSRLAVGTTLTRRELMILALMSSENRAASALLRNYPGGKKAGVAAMNRKAREIGMTTAKFVEGTGLSGDNRSSPVDLVRLVKAADAYTEIREFSTTTEHAIKVGRHVQMFRNTNPLVKSEDWAIGLTKTGFLNEAGRCLVMRAQVAGMPVIFVLMDSVGKLTRVGDANRVRQWLESVSPLNQMARSEI